MMWGSALVVASGLALAALGVWALTLRPRGTATLAFAAYAGGTGAFVAVAWSGFAWPDVAWLPVGVGGSLPTQVLALALWTSLVVLVLGVPRPLGGSELRLLVRPALLAAALFAGAFGIEAARGEITARYAVNVGNWGATVLAIAIALERFRAATGPTADEERRHLSLLATALGLIVGEASGRIVVETASGAPVSGLVLASNVVVPALAALRLLAAWRTPGRSARDARDVALLTMGAWLMGGAWHAWSDFGPARFGSLGVATLAGGMLLARGALVGNLLGAGVQLRWGISKSSVAAAFVAVFFVASEAAQQFFGESFGGAYVGIAAAGALVFALAPLQRAAERLAEKAVPVAAGGAASAGAMAPETLYLNAARLAMRDRRLSREEEAHLHRLAEGLGLSASRAHELLVEAEREAVVV